MIFSILHYKLSGFFGRKIGFRALGFGRFRGSHRCACQHTDIQGGGGGGHENFREFPAKMAKFSFSKTIFEKF